MYRTIVTYFTLIAFINTYCVKDVLATMTYPELRVVGQQEPWGSTTIRYQVDLNKEGQYVLDGEHFKYMEMFDLELESNGVLVGQLTHNQGQVYLNGYDAHNFYIGQLPWMQSLHMNMGGSVTFETLVGCNQSLDVAIAGKATFLNGFRLGERNGLASFTGGDIELVGKSFAPLLKLTNVQSLQLQKNNLLECGLIATDGMMKSLNILGELYVGIAALEVESLSFNSTVQIAQAKLDVGTFTNTKQFSSQVLTLKSTKATNTGNMSVGQAHMDNGNFFNAGQFHAKNVQGTGSWSNGPKGHVVVEDLFHGNFSNYTDDGSTTVWGLASIQAETGRLTGDFKARNAMIHYLEDVFVPDRAKFTIENYFALNSGKNMNFHGSIMLKYRHDWPQTEPSSQVRHMLRNIEPGAYLSAKGNLNRSGTVSSNNSSVHFFAGGKYEDVGGSYRSGFFDDNNTRINAAHAKLGAESKSFSDSIVIAKLVELMGARDIAGALRIFATELTQHNDDKTKAGSIFVQAKDATLAGVVELSQVMTLKLSGFFKTLSSNLIKGGKLEAQADSAALAGRLLDLTLQMATQKDITLEKTFDAKIKASSMEGENILHKAGSKLVTKGTNAEKAKHDITLEYGSKVAAQNNFFKSENAVYNAGRVDAQNLYHADTGFHYNWFGGRIYAKNAVIDADWLNATFLSDLSADSVEINTLLNLNALARVHGRDSLTVSALVNAQFGLNQSNAYTSNSLLSINPLSLLTFSPIAFIPLSLPSLGKSTEAPKSSSWGTSYLRQALSLASMIEGPYRSYLLGAQLLWGGKDLILSAIGMATTNTTGDEESYWRSSRIMKRTGPVLALGLSTYQTLQGAMNLYDRVYPELPKLPTTLPDAGSETGQTTPPQTSAQETATTATPELTKPQLMMWNATQTLGLDAKLGVKAADVPGMMNATRDMGLNALGITAVDNSLFCWNNGWNLTGHITRRNIWDYDSSWTMAFSTYVSTGQGADYGTKHTLKSTAIANKWSIYGLPVASGNYVVGGHKNIFLDYTVDAAGDVLLKKNTDIHAQTNTLKAGGSMQAEEGMAASAEKSAIVSESDLDFAGKAHGSNESVVASTKGNATLRTGGSVTSDKSASVTAAKKAVSEKDTLIQGENAAFHGQGGTDHAGKIAGQKVVMGNKTSKTHFMPTGEIEILPVDEKNQKPAEQQGPKPLPDASKEDKPEQPAVPDYDLEFQGSDILDEGKIYGKPGALTQISAEEGLHTGPTAQVNLPEGHMETSGHTNNVDAGANIAVGTYVHKGDASSTFGGNIDATKAVEISSQGHTAVTKNAHIKLKDKDYKPPVREEPMAEEEQPKLDEAIKFSGKTTNISGQIETNTGIQMEGAEALQLSEGLDLQAEGDAYAITLGHLVKEKGTNVDARNISNHGAVGVRIDGTNTAAESFTAMSRDGAVVAESGSNTTAGEEIAWIAKQDLIRKEGSKDTAKRVFHEGKTLYDGGKTQASEFASRKTTGGPMHMGGTSESHAPHHQIDVAGQLFVDPASRTTGSTMNLSGQNIPAIPDLFTQTGQWANWRLSDHVRVDTDQHVHFTQSATSASRGFELHTNQITIDPNLNFRSPDILILDSILENLNIGHGTTLGGGIHTSLSSGKDVIYGYEKTLVYGTKGKKKHKVVGVNYSTVTVLGGTGVDYEYTDPATGQKSIRKLGINVNAGGQVIGTGVNYGASTGDIRVAGVKGVTNSGDSQRYISKVKTKKNWLREKNIVYHDTAFCAPVMSTDGKIQILSNEGGFTGVANFFCGGQGTEILTHGHVNLPYLTGKKGKTTSRNYGDHYESHSRKRQGIATTTTMVNPGDSPARVWSTTGNVNAPGFVYFGPESALSLKGKKLFLSKPILNHSSSSSSTQWSADYSLLTHLKSLNALQAVKDTVNDVNQGAYGDALMHATAPSVEVGVDMVNTKSKWQTTGPGSILAKDLVMEFSEGIHQTNAYGINVLNDAWVSSPIWQQSGAKLKFSHESNYAGIFARASSGQDPTIGIRFGGSKTKGYTWEAAENNIGGTLHAHIGQLDQDAAHMSVGSAEGSIDEFTSRTRQGKSKTTGWGVTVDYKGYVTANYWENASRTTNHTSGLTVHNANNGFTIGTAKLKGANLTGVIAQAMSYKALPEDYTNRGFSLGISFDGKDAAQTGDISKVKNVVAHAGVSNNDFSVQASVKLSDNPRDRSKLWNDVGTVKVNGIPVPLMYSVNPEAWNEFGTDLREVGGKIADGAGHVVDAIFPAQQPAMQLSQAGRPQPESPSLIEVRELLPPQDTVGINQKEQHENHPSKTAEITEKTATTIHALEEAEHEIGATSHATSEASHEAASVGHGAGAASKETKIILQGQEVRTLSSAAPAFAENLEELLEPIIFEGKSFKYRIAGTNCYLENPSQLQSVLDALKASAASKSIYEQKAIGAINNNEFAVFHFDSKLTPFGTQGHVFTTEGLKGLNAKGTFGSQILTGDYVAVGNDLFTNRPHEGMHCYRVLEGGGYFTPGHIPGNPALSNQNLYDLLGCYGADAKAMGFTSFKSIPQNVHALTPVEGYLMFNAPWQYFEQSFRAGLVSQGMSLSEPQIQRLVKQAEQSILHGKPLANVYKDPKLNEIFASSAKEMAAEIPAFFTEADGRIPGLISKAAPSSHDWLQTLDDKSVYNFDRTPHPTKLPPAAPGIWTRFAQGAVKYVPVADAALHVWVENSKPDTIDLTHAMGRAVVPTIVDAGVYGSAFSIIAESAGNPYAIGAAAFTIGCEFLPEYSKEDIHATYDMMLYAAEQKDPRAYLQAQIAAQHMVNIREVKRIGTALRHVSEAITDTVDEAFPKFTPSLSSGFKLMFDTGRNELVKVYNLVATPVSSVTPHMQPKETRTFTEMRQDANAYYKALVMQNEEKRWIKILDELDKAEKSIGE